GTARLLGNMAARPGAGCPSRCVLACAAGPPGRTGGTFPTGPLAPGRGGWHVKVSSSRGRSPSVSTAKGEARRSVEVRQGAFLRALEAAETAAMHRDFEE